MKNPKNIEKFIDEALALQTEEARKAGALGYMARALVQATMPHSKTKEDNFTRRNGYYSLTMMADPDFGLPYGSIPRLLMSWITTEAVQTKNQELILGDSLSGFMRELGLVATGGRWGSVTRLKEQMKRLVSCSIRFKFEDGNQLRIKKLDPIDSADLFWTPRNPNQGTLFESTITLSKPFFEEIIQSPIVYRVDTLKLLKQSSMAVDLYIWITYRNSYAVKPFYIPWEALQMQFGAGYPFTPQGKSNFKQKFLEALKKVAIAYPEANKLRDEGQNLLFIPGRPDVPKLTK
ncbi:replication protein RepA [Sporomusa aerivorans]|uniref:replication protein RepA n=1 Tax=Sporomusa aerivorans TaxID=204936 RepID=UPI00352B671D